MPRGLRGFGDGDGPDRPRARSAGNRGANARGLLAHGPSAPNAELRPSGDPPDRTESVDRDGTVHPHRRGRAQSNWLVHNHLGAHSRRLANGARSFVIEARRVGSRIHRVSEKSACTVATYSRAIASTGASSAALRAG